MTLDVVREWMPTFNRWPEDYTGMENFFGILKTEMFYRKHFKTINELEKEIVGYIDYYNNTRIKTRLNGMSHTLLHLFNLLSSENFAGIGFNG